MWKKALGGHAFRCRLEESIFQPHLFKISKKLKKVFALA